MAEWRKSSFSGGADENCVEVAHLGNGLAFRDSKDPAGPVLTFHGSGFPGQLPSGPPSMVRATKITQAPKPA